MVTGGGSLLCVDRAVEDLQGTGSENEKAQTRTLCSFRRGSVCAVLHEARGQPTREARHGHFYHGSLLAGVLLMKHHM